MINSFLNMRNKTKRLIDLLDEEQDIPILAPVMPRESIYYFMVKGYCVARVGLDAEKIRK